MIKNAMCCEFSLIFHIPCHCQETWGGENTITWAQSISEGWKPLSLLWCQKSRNESPREKTRAGVLAPHRLTLLLGFRSMIIPGSERPRSPGLGLQGALGGPFPS